MWLAGNHASYRGRWLRLDVSLLFRTVYYVMNDPVLVLPGITDDLPHEGLVFDIVGAQRVAM